MALWAGFTTLDTGLVARSVRAELDKIGRLLKAGETAGSACMLCCSSQRPRQNISRKGHRMIVTNPTVRGSRMIQRTAEGHQRPLDGLDRGSSGKAP
jgi:hypothetical protein